MSKAVRSSKKTSGPKSLRTTLVTAALVVALGLTSVLLLIMAPAPLAPPAQSLVVPEDVALPLKAVYQTRKPIVPGRWKGILIHHSKTRRGDLLTLSQIGINAHFVVGNGDGCGNGEVQFGQQWQEQQAAAIGSNPRGNQIVICVVGDFDQSSPTSAQKQRLTELVRSLQAELKIPSEQVQALARNR